MMKQFLRVKQIADQKFQRSEKIGVLSDELNAVEKRVDLIKESCSVTGKKLSACIQRLASPDNTCSDRRNATKKIPEAILAQCMEEWGLSLGENSILGLTLVDYARIQETLAHDLLSYKIQLEENVVEPLQNILNVDINKILKYRKQLFKLTSEMDNAKTRYQSAHRNSQQATGNGAAAATAKAQQLREESEDIISRVDQCKDSLTAEMFNLISREPEMSYMFVKLCQLQLEYHRKAFYMLENALPELEAQIKNCSYQPVFGIPLEDHLQVTRREIATVIETCVCWLLDSAMEEEGLFRIGGSMIKIKKMKSAFDAGFHHLIEEEKDPHNVAGVLKLYLRSLPNPLLTYELYDHWMEAAMDPDHDSRLRALWNVVQSLPEGHFSNLRYLIKFLSKLCQNSEVNKMSVQNVAIVIGPNLLWPPIEDSALGMNMTATNLHSSIMDTLITYADWFFPGDCEFYISTPTSPRHLNGLYGSQNSLSTHKLSNGDSAVDSMSSSPTNSSPKSPSPRIPLRPRKKAAPKAPQTAITRSVSCTGFQANILARAKRLATLSISHENLLNAEAKNALHQANERSTNVSNRNGIFLPETNGKNTDVELRPAHPVVQRPPSRPKPPRHQRNGLPPLAERTRRSVERPSVPPPERPASFSRSETISSSEESKVLDPEDITISFDSSSSDSYNECLMSFADESDHDSKHQMEVKTEKTVSFSENTQFIDDPGYAEEEQEEQDTSEVKWNQDNKELGSKEIIWNQDSKEHKVQEIKHIQDSKEDWMPKFDLKQIPKERSCADALDLAVSVPKKVVKVATVKDNKTKEVIKNSPDKTIFSNYIENSEPLLDSVENEELAPDCHFTGGTPTWFDHYGDVMERKSHTVWFCDNEGIVSGNKLSTIDENTPSSNDSFRTIIEVGNTDTQNSSTFPSTVSGIAIKLRVNSETQDTRL